MGYVDFFRLLGRHKRLLTRKELLMLRGQALAGDYDGAQKGLTRLLERKRAEAGRTLYATQTKLPV